MAAGKQPFVQTAHAYDDRFVNIDDKTGTLTLKNYLLYKPTLKVHIPTLLYIRPASEFVNRLGLRPNGISLISGIVWARDWHQGAWVTGPGSHYERSFVIKAKGDKLRVGFSVEDPETFLGALEGVHPGLRSVTVSAEEEAEMRSELARESTTKKSVEAQIEH